MRRTLLTGLTLLTLLASTGWAATIDVGPDATNRATTRTSGYTRISATNAANATGTLDTVEIYANTDMTGVKVGTFYLSSGTTYVCRDSATIGNVTSGSKQTFAGLSIDVEAGDLLGLYWSGGALEADSTGGGGMLVPGLGDYATPGASTSYTSYSGYELSIYATGITAPAKAGTPSPANAATDQTTSVDVSWAAVADATSYDVYFGTDSTPDADGGSSEFIGNQAGTSYDPGALANATIYWWRIDSVNAGGTTEGDVWLFVTASAGGAGGGSIFRGVVE